MPRITGSFIAKAGGSFIWADPKAEYHDCKDMVVQNFIVARKQKERGVKVPVAPSRTHPQ